jgi:hypothetical protein
MRKTWLLAAAAAVLSASPTLVAAQTGVIAGIVVDEAGKPIVGAEVQASAEKALTRTDSAGRFELRNLESGDYTIRARHIGFLPTRMTADLGKGGRADVKIELKARPAMLDSVIIVANGNCPERSYVGFLCRRRGGKGVYLTDDDIFDKNAREIGDIFRGVPGFRIELVPTIWGRLPMPLSTKASLCLNALVNGRIASPTNPMPRFATEMIAVEIYASPSDVPDEYQRYVWGKQGRQTQSYRDHGGATAGDRCSLAVYWTSFS